jgi:hypothetical protein
MENEVVGLIKENLHCEAEYQYVDSKHIFEISGMPKTHWLCLTEELVTDYDFISVIKESNCFQAFTGAGKELRLLVGSTFVNELDENFK